MPVSMEKNEGGGKILDCLRDFKEVPAAALTVLSACPCVGEWAGSGSRGTRRTAPLAVKIAAPAPPPPFVRSRISQ